MAAAPQPSTDTTTARRAQPIEALHLPEALLTVRTVSTVTGNGVATIWRWGSAGRFSKPIKHGSCTRWVAGDVSAWLRERAAQ